MVRTSAFTEAGGFASDLAPAYYEDTDLCFALRAKGYRIRYQPRSIVDHVEGASYGSNLREEARAMQERSRHRFAAKWHDALRDHMEPNPEQIERAARRLSGTRTIVVVDEHVPFTDRDAGSRRIFFLIELLRKRGWHVIFGSLDRNDYQPYSDVLRDLGTELICGFGPDSVAALKRLHIAVDAAWLCRQGPAARVLSAFRRNFDPTYRVRHRGSSLRASPARTRGTRHAHALAVDAAAGTAPRTRRRRYRNDRRTRARSASRGRHRARLRHSGDRAGRYREAARVGIATRHRVSWKLRARAERRCRLLARHGDHAAGAAAATRRAPHACGRGSDARGARAGAAQR